MKEKIITANKDRGTSVGFSNSEYSNPENYMHCQCEHKWKEYEFFHFLDSGTPIKYTACMKCGKVIPEPGNEYLAKLVGDLGIENHQLKRELKTWQDMFHKLEKESQPIDFKIKENLEVIKDEFLKWLDEECPHGTMTYDLSHDFAEKLRNRLDELLPNKTF